MLVSLSPSSTCANIVLVKKKIGQIRCYIEFRNLIKPTPQDEFPLLNIDMLVDFMDGSSGYSYIK